MNSPRFFDKHQYAHVRSGNLPHWQQGLCTQFVTFRLADSLPENVLSEYRERCQLFENAYPKPWSEEVSNMYHAEIGDHVDMWLDRGIGSCVLKNPDARMVVADAINSLDGIRMDVYAYVIMPNHMHILMAPYEDMAKIMHSIKRYTALGINRLMHRGGALWQREYFDRLVRSKEDFNHYVDYIRNNPVGFPAEHYTLGGKALEGI